MLPCERALRLENCDTTPTAHDPTSRNHGSSRFLRYLSSASSCVYVVSACCRSYDPSTTHAGKRKTSPELSPHDWKCRISPVIQRKRDCQHGCWRRIRNCAYRIARHRAGAIGDCDSGLATGGDLLTYSSADRAACENATTEAATPVSRHLSPNPTFRRNHVRRREALRISHAHRRLILPPGRSVNIRYRERRSHHGQILHRLPHRQPGAQRGLLRE
jgi:hypothetical protein